MPPRGTRCRVTWASIRRGWSSCPTASTSTRSRRPRRPRRYEGSSLVTLEAMAHGRPVVGTRAGGIPDKVIDGTTGRLVDPGDVAGLAAALGEVCADRPGREAMGAAGRCRVRSEFSSSALVERTLALYETLLREARP